MLSTLVSFNPLCRHVIPHPLPDVLHTRCTTMGARVRVVLLFLLADICVSNAQINNSSNDIKQQPQQQQQQRSILDEPIRFSSKAKDSCTMVVSGAGDYTRLRVSCKGPNQGQTPGRSYYCDFQGKPNLCRAYNLNSRHYFTQMMWDMRKLSHACQGPKVYRPPMCKKYPDDAQMTFLTSWPKTNTKPSKSIQEQRKPVVPVQTKPVKPMPGKSPQTKKTTPKPGKTRPTEQPESKSSRLASEYCWKSFHGVCSYVISWFQN